MNPPSVDPLLSRLLAWRVSPPPEPQFRAAVWARIARARSERDQPWLGYLRNHAVGWSLAFAVGIGSASFTGLALGRQHVAGEREAVLATYLAAIDAHAMAAAASPGRGVDPARP